MEPTVAPVSYADLGRLQLGHEALVVGLHESKPLISHPTLDAALAACRMRVQAGVTRAVNCSSAVEKLRPCSSTVCMQCSWAASSVEDQTS